MWLAARIQKGAERRFFGAGSLAAELLPVLLETARGTAVFRAPSVPIRLVEEVATRGPEIRRRPSS